MIGILLMKQNKTVQRGPLCPKLKGLGLITSESIVHKRAKFNFPRGKLDNTYVLRLRDSVPRNPTKSDKPLQVLR
jgi:hypothetical protein